MASNRALYDRAIEQSREAARQNDWARALKEAVRALQEFPQDPEARKTVAIALFNTEKLPQALQMFDELRASDANNPFFLEYIARIHERLGNVENAVATYQRLSELHQQRRLVPQAIEALRHLLRLAPADDQRRLQLARLLETSAAAQEASLEYLVLAQHAQAQPALDSAAEYAEEALRLDPNNREAREMLLALQDAMAQAAGVTAQVSAAGVEVRPLPGNTGALRMQQFTIDRLIEQAEQCQANGDSAGAIENYEQAIANGLDRADVYYSLGLLYEERQELQKAVQYLSLASQDLEYALSAHYSLGGVYRALGQLAEAAQEYEQTIALVDLETIGKAESDDLIRMYEGAAEIYTEMGDIARAASLYSTLAAFLGSKRWGKERTAEFNAKAKELTERNMFAKLRQFGTGMLSSAQAAVPEVTPAQQPEVMPETWGKIRSITDFLRPRGETVEVEPQPAIAPDPLDLLPALPQIEKPAFVPLTPLKTNGLDESVERWVQVSERYVEQGLLYAALDSCHEVIRQQAEYLPIHLRLGEIYERLGWTNEALAKYQLLIDTFVARNTPQEAIDVYLRLIELTPDTINARTRLAELLRQANRVDEAADQLAHVAATYFRMGQSNKALEEYRRVLQLAPRNPQVRTQYGQVLIKLERFEAAVGEFRRALEYGDTGPAAVARLCIALVLQGEDASAIWDTLAALLEQLKNQPAQANAVQSEFRSALLLSDLALLRYMLGIIQQSLGQHQSAVLELEQALELSANNEDPLLPAVLVHQMLADSYIALGQAPAALEQLRRAQEVAGAYQPDPAIKHRFAVPLSVGEVARRLAEAYAATDDLSGAEQALMQAKKLLPYDRAVYTKLAEVYFRQGRLSEALTQLDDLATYYENRQDLDRALETLEYGYKLAPNNIAVNNRLARMYLRRGLIDKGLEGLGRLADLQRRASQLKDAVASLQEMANIHWTLGRMEEARLVYDKITQIAPNDIDARIWLTLMHTQAGRLKEAIVEKRQIVRILLQQRDLDGAIAELHQIFALDQNDLDAQFQLGDVLMQRQEFEQALRVYNRLHKHADVDKDRVEALISAASMRLAQQRKGS